MANRKARRLRFWGQASLLQSVMLLLLAGVVLYTSAALYRMVMPKTRTAAAVQCTAAQFAATHDLTPVDEPSSGICLTVPIAALRTDDSGSIVYIRRGGRAVSRDVRVLMQSDSHVLVTPDGADTPLTVGDPVIVRAKRLYEGMPTE